MNMRGSDIIPTFHRVLTRLGDFSEALTGDADGVIDNKVVVQFAQTAKLFARGAGYLSSATRTRLMLDAQFKLDMTMEEIEENELYDEDPDTDIVAELAELPDPEKLSCPEYKEEFVESIVTRRANRRHNAEPLHPSRNREKVHLDNLRKRLSFSLADKLKVPAFDVRNHLQLATLHMIGTSGILQEAIEQPSFEFSQQV